MPMARLIKEKVLPDGTIQFDILLCAREVLGLGGNMHNVHIFFPGICNTKTRIVGMGINNSTKYFEVPESLNLKHSPKKVKPAFRPGVSCQKLESEHRVFFIYVVNRSKAEEKAGG
jgi:hypothetical protein